MRACRDRMEPHKQKRLLRCDLQQPLIPFHVVDKHGLPPTQRAMLNQVNQLKTVSEIYRNILDIYQLWPELDLSTW